MFKLIDILGFTVLFAAVLEGATRLLPWLFVLAGIIIGLVLWALGSIGKKLDRLEKASGNPPSRYTVDEMHDRGDAG